VDSDPGRLRERVDQATARLAATAAGLTDQQAWEPSLLPEWSRGHVLTHLARNADGLRNLLIWARTGVETPQYPSVEARNAAIEAGSGRPAAELAGDLERSAAAFAAEAAAVPPGAWDAQVHGIAGRAHAAWFTLFRRLTEVEIHHVDLRAGYAPPDWPELFVADELERVTEFFASRGDVPACQVQVTSPAGDTVSRFALGAAPAGSAAGPVTVSGPGWRVLAWLTGRDDGASLSVAAGPGSAWAGPPPRMPAWG
jgi:maleylpyruvate isomerase